MNFDQIIFGVSPAFIVSKYGKDFTIRNFCDGLERIQALGFDAYQPEIFLPDQLGDWVSGGAVQVYEKAKALKMGASQFVAHFLFEYFSSPDALKSNYDIDILKQTLEAAKAFPECSVLTIPLGPFDGQEVQSQEDFKSVQENLKKKILSYYEQIQKAGFRMALEILPGSVIGVIGGFLQFINALEVPDLGLNFDTGHAWACRERVALLRFQLSVRIFATHLCDNNSDENLSLSPGKGTMQWSAILKNLLISGYRGSLDLEIGCPTADVETEYKDGLQTIQSIVKQL